MLAVSSVGIALLLLATVVSVLASRSRHDTVETVTRRVAPPPPPPTAGTTGESDPESEPETSGGEPGRPGDRHVTHDTLGGEVTDPEAGTEVTGEPPPPPGPVEPGVAASGTTAPGTGSPSGEPALAEPSPQTEPDPLAPLADLPWPDRYESLCDRLRHASRAEDADSVARCVRWLEATLDEALEAARRSREQSEWLVQLLEDEHRLLAAHPTLQARARAAVQLRGRHLERDATGPATIAAALAFAREHGLSETAKRLAALQRGLETDPDVPAAVIAQRERARRKRAAVRAEVRRYLARRGSAAAPILTNLIDALATRAPWPQEIVAEIRALIAAAMPLASPSRLRLEQRLASLRDRHGPATNGRREPEDARRRIDAVRTRLAGPLLHAIDRCLAAGEPGFGFDLLRMLLAIDADNPRAHRGLGHVRMGGRWVRRFEAQQRRRGLVWDPERGWIVARWRRRYDTGQYYDLVRKRWQPLGLWERVHADPATPWRIETEHFELLSTAPLSTSAHIASRLEAFFLQAFRTFDLVFARDGDPRGTRLVFGEVAGGRRLRVWVYRNREQFTAHARPPTDWAAGFYRPADGTAYFHANNQTFDVETLQHECTHQILGEFGGKGDPPAWLAEGAATYLEAAQFDAHRRLVIPDVEGHDRLQNYRSRRLAGEAEHSFRTITRYVTSRQWDSGDIDANYRGAAAAFYFLLHFDDGRYRADTIEMLRDAYRGTLHEISWYYGLSVATLDRLMDRFYRLAP